MEWIEKQRNVLDFTLSSILRRKGKNIALFTVYTAMVFLLASVMFFTHAIKKEAALVLREAPEIVVQRMQAGRHALMPLAYLEKIRAIRGVSRVEGRLWGYYYDPVVGANYTLLTGRKSLPPGSMVIGNGISRARGVYEGDLMSFRTYSGENAGFKVTEILSAESELVSADLMLVNEEDLRHLFGLPREFVTDLAVTVRNPRELNTIAAKIADLLPDARPIIRDEILRTYEAAFDWRGGIMVVLLAGAVLAFVIFAWDKGSGLSAGERREIGILKAIGWETSDILLMKFWEGAVISLTAFLLGTILAYLHVFFASSILFGPALKGWSVLYPSFKLMPAVDLYQVATLFFLTVVPYIAASILPSWQAATVDPDSIMRT